MIKGGIDQFVGAEGEFDSRVTGRSREQAHLRNRAVGELQVRSISTTEKPHNSPASGRKGYKEWYGAFDTNHCSLSANPRLRREEMP
jgi:hypothetical protein